MAANKNFSSRTSLAGNTDVKSRPQIGAAKGQTNDDERAQLNRSDNPDIESDPDIESEIYVQLYWSDGNLDIESEICQGRLKFESQICHRVSTRIILDDIYLISPLNC